ncbi:hypothetical protein MNV49_000317 [Pseudohyphozyma bogoriensis]|nr:hypothetical protein MNV49_000317 [Pseudohyphozyma bogoriensis]
MAARKLATEIDRTLKKVAEGVEIFEGIFEKIQQSTNQAQKEKLESDLKSQIKKLQRLRDQIKTWLQSNDIKDKQPLLDNRKLIETQMERFKACEKEMKTKAFSKEGLSAATKLDPKEQQKLELCNWITTMVDELSRQVEQAEAEVETLQLNKKKKDTERTQRLEDLETLNDRRTWHIGRLELILRLLENGNLQTESVSDVKDDIAYFVESNTEEDFEEDEGIYDELNLEEEEENFGVGGDDIQSSHDSTSVADDVATPASIPPTPSVATSSLPAAVAPKTPAKETVKSPPTTDLSEKSPTAKGKATPARKPTLDSTTPRPVISTPTRTASGPAPVARAVPAPLPPIRYAAAAAAANAPPTPSSASVATPSTPASAPPPGLGQASAASSPEVTKAIAPESTSQHSSSAAPSPMIAPVVAPNLARASPALSAASVNGAYPPSSSPSGASSQQPAIASPTSSASLPLPPTEAISAPGDESLSPKLTSAPADRTGNEPRLPSSLADLVTSFESAKQKSMKRDNDLGSIHKILDAGFANVPQPLDAEKPKYYVPRNPFATPAYYPHEPSGQFANPALFSKFDVDTLFYIFYYCQGTYLQYLAASELKKQSWRFHKQYLTWFQRANEPQQITEEFEQGVYLYFDWEGSWCQRRKSDFRFEYRYLSSD